MQIEKEDMKIAIIASTPFQTLNALNLVCNTIEKKAQLELFYRNFSFYTNEILLRIREQNIFSYIYEYDLVSKEKRFRYYCNDFIQAVFPKRFIQQLVKEDIDLTKKQYDYITVTSGTEFETAMSRIFPDAKLIAYDDGLGSYVGDIIHDHKLHWIWSLLGRRTDHMKPTCLYVNNRDFCESILAKDIRSLCTYRQMSQDYRNLISYVFGTFDNNLYADRRIIYLGQPLDELEIGLCEIREKIERILQKYREHIIYRRHPREMHDGESCFYEDQAKTIWEIICEESISDEHVLISVCSSTQIMPKVLFDKEPWLIFTYKIFDLKNRDIVEKRFYPIIRKIRQEYRADSKIFEPDSLEELANILYKIRSLAASGD